MDYSDMSREHILVCIANQEETIRRAETFRKAPGVGNQMYISYTRGITQAQERIADYRAELTRRVQA